MKALLITLLSAGLITAVTLSLSSCAQDAQRSQALSRLANTALVAAELGGAINGKQSAAIRGGGALLLTVAGEQSTEGKLAVISDAVVTYAVVAGKITPEQAAQLRAAGAVPLTDPGPATAPLPAGK